MESESYTDNKKYVWGEGRKKENVPRLSGAAQRIAAALSVPPVGLGVCLKSVEYKNKIVRPWLFILLL